MQEELEPHQVKLSQYSTFLKVKQFLETKEETILLESDQVFEFELDHVLFELPKNERDITLEYLKKKYPSLNLLRQKKYEEVTPGFLSKAWSFLTSSQGFDEKQLDLTRSYYILRISKESQGLFRQMKKDEFLQVNQIPIYFKEYIPLLEKLKNNEDVFKILDILEYCNQSKFSLNFTVLKDLIYFMFYKDEELTQVDIHKLHQLVATVTSKLIIQFENLQLMLEQSDQSRYQQMVTQIQLIQLQASDQTPQSLLQFLENQQPTSLVTIAKVALLDLQNYDKIYCQYLKEIVQSTNEVNYDNIVQLEENQWEIGYEKTEQLYFLTLFQFWIKSNYLVLLEIETYVQDAIKTAKENSKNKNSTDLENKVRNIIYQESKQNDMLQYLAKTILLYTGTGKLIVEKYSCLVEQENSYVDRLKQFNLINPINIFTFDKILIIYRIVNTVSHRYFQENLKQYFILIQQLSRQDIRLVSKQLIQSVNQNLEMNICDCIQIVKEIVNHINQNDQRLLLKILATYYECRESYPFYRQFLNQQIELTQLRQLLRFQVIMHNFKEDLNELLLFSQEDWNFIKIHEVQLVIKLINTLVEKIIYGRQFGEATHILKEIQVKSIEGQAMGYIFESLKIYEYPEIQQIFSQNQEDQLDLNIYTKTIKFLIQLYQQFLSEYYLISIFEMNFNQIFCRFANYYCYEFIKRQINCNHQDLEQALIIVYHSKVSNQSTLLECAYNFYCSKPDTYARLLGEFNYFDNNHLQPFEMRLISSVQKYPSNIGISLEEFNISLSFDPATIQEEQKKLIDLWLQDIKNPDTFRDLIPLFFNSIKRGESLETLLQQVNGSIELMPTEKIGFFNRKALFQLFFNNSNSELKVMLLKIYCKLNPVPLVYRSSDIENPLIINKEIFYIFQECIPIINFSFSKSSQFIGKTELINSIFYRDKKFQIRDTCDMNQQTVDIMFDYSFNGSRKLCVADAHGNLPLEILNKILPLFTIWIIQINSEIQIGATVDSLLTIPENIRKNKVICFIIRNSNCSQLPQEQSDLLKQQGILFQQMKDVSQDQLSGESISREINTVSRFLYGIINNKELVTQQQFYDVIIDQDDQNQDFQEKSKLIDNLVEELEKIVKLDEGFSSSQAFPIRNIESKIKFKKNEFSKLNLKQPYANTETLKTTLQGEIRNLENTISFQRPTNLLILFSKIFDLKNYYIVYLWFVDKIRQFNETHTNFLYKENEKINDEIQKLKQEKKQKENAQGINFSDLEQFIQTIELKKQELQKNQDRILLRNIGIEMFWRELIQQQQLCKDQMQTISPSEIVFQMIAKGEPFEFLNGDSLQIDYKFLQQLINHFKDKGKERVLVFSVLGPQSSGKSTILNKIFGCHFWTSVGRCTKGIYLQVLKVYNKEINKDLFDYVVLLDTEGLQSPNQQDQEFDKKIALFVLTISDIILINVKGDINQQFRNLVEMCVFTLGQLKSISQNKQLSWCFNQNTDTNNLHPFESQLEKITQNLQRTDFQEQNHIDYSEILEATGNNIAALGFSQIEKNWLKSMLTGVFADWKQQQIIPSYSDTAYSYGINIIKRFMNKRNKENEEFYSLQYCFEKMHTDWQRIERLPDLLEFSELIQHQQNLLMKAEFENIIRNQNRSSYQEIIQTIEDQISQRGQLVLDDFSQIKQAKYQEIQTLCDLIQKQMTDQLLAIKNLHKISKKIFIKYENMIRERISSQRSELQLSVQNDIKNYETDFQKKKGFLKLDEFVNTLNQNENSLKQYQGDETKIKQEFEKIWKQIITNHFQSQEDMFRECSNKLFDVISQEFSSYSFRTENQNEYKEMMRKFFSKQPSNDDFAQIFSTFEQELKQNQFIVIERCQQNYQLNEIFFRHIDLKLQSSTPSDILQIDQFFQQQITISYVKKQDILEYLNTENILQDLYALYLLRKRFRTIASDLKAFFIQIKMLGVEFNQESIDNFIFDVIKEQPLARCGPVHFAFKNEIDKNLNNEQLLNYLQQTCRRLRIHQQKLNEKFNEKEFGCSQTDIVIYVQQNVVIRHNSVQQQDNQILEYIYNPLVYQHYYVQFRARICQIINTLMLNEENWKKVYFQIFTLIHQESQSDMNSIFEIGINKNQINTQYNVSLINIILGKIQEQIKVYNKQLANFGVMFDVVGERCMTYFAMLIIWKIQCYGQYNFVQNNKQKLMNLKDEQYSKFKADIQQNKVEQSQIRGTALAQEIFNLRRDKLYLEYEGLAEQKIQKEFEDLQDSYQLVKQLDSKILERNNGTSDQEIIKYVRDHKQYVEEEVNERIKNVKGSLQKYFEAKIRQDMRYHLQLVEIHSRNLKTFSLEKVKAEDYFVDNTNKGINYPNLLYKIVQQCLEGNLSKKYFDMIKIEYQDAFKTANQQVFSVAIISNVQNVSDQEIQILKWFITAFDQKIQEFIATSYRMPFLLDKLNIQNLLDEIKFKLIGCLETCPICKRKCDEDPKDKGHRHKCRNGHQLRGITGVLVGSSPSLFTCEEIQDENYIVVQETQARKSWREIKASYNNWLFSNLDREVLERHKQKIMNIWNHNIGQMICRYLSDELGQPVQFIQKSEQSLASQTGISHYILILDRSGSMEGKKWVSIQTAALQFTIHLQNQPNTKISVILFNHEAKCVLNNRIPNLGEVQNALIFEGGGTDFNKAFKEAQIIINSRFQENEEIYKMVMLFYTDGDGGYPQEAIKLFQQMPVEIRQKIELVACSEEVNSAILEQTIKALGPFLGRVELRNSVSTYSVQQVWTETISQKFHNLQS